VISERERTRISDAVAKIRETLARAAERAGRSTADVTLVAVTKNVSWPVVQAAFQSGLRIFGESRVQEALEKRKAWPEDLSGTPPPIWHMIGHLQTNKAGKAVDLFDTIQSLDSERLARVLDRDAKQRNRKVRCLVEVKSSPEPSKHGVAPEDLDRFLDEAAAWPALRIEGLMTIAPLGASPSDARPYFRRMRSLFERFYRRFAGPPALSMGMSNDFEIAVEEGSTMIRIGTAIFGKRPRPADGPAPSED
jgi:PLP dependent protein